MDFLDCISLEDWLSVWGLLLDNVKTLFDLPTWLQMYPGSLFQIFNRSGSGRITKEELRNFYIAFLEDGKIDDNVLDEFTHNAYMSLSCVSAPIIVIKVVILCNNFSLESIP